MNYISIMTCFALVVFLTGCNEPNPLEKHLPEKIAGYLFENTNLAITKCSEIWAHPETANGTTLSQCDPAATHVANLLNEGGFGPNISSRNVQTPAVWKAYTILLEEHEEKMKEDLSNVFKWGPGKK